MNLRRIAKPLSAIVLAASLVTIGAAPADARIHKADGQSTNVTFHKAPSVLGEDTGWGKR